MDYAGVDPDLQFRIELCRLLIDKLNDLFALFEDEVSDVSYIDTRGVLCNDRHYRKDWDNEMHPSWSGFRKIVDQRLIPELAR
jgi:hypothetical protein